MAYTSGEEIIRAAAAAVRSADPERLAPCDFMNVKGCMCAAGHVVYNNDDKLRKAVDGFRLMQEAGILDEDQLSIIAAQIDGQMGDCWEETIRPFRLTSKVEKITTTFDSNCRRTVTVEQTATALERLIPEQKRAA